MTAAVLVAVVVLVPLVFVVVSAVSGWADWRTLIRPRVLELLGNTVQLVLAGVLASALLGTAAAWLVARTDLPGRRIWNVLMVAPLAVPAFVNSFGWVSLTPRVESFAGAVLIVTLSYFPLVYLPVAATLRGLDPALEDSAAALGLNRGRVFTRVVLPQLRPALFGGSLLVGVHLLSEFGAIQRLRFPTLATGVYDQYRATFGGSAAILLAAVLAFCCLLLLSLEQRWRGTLRLAGSGAGGVRAAELVRLGPWTVPALAGLAGLAGLALGVPLASLGRWMVTGSSTAFPIADLTSTALKSFGLGALAAAVTVTAALPIAWLVVRHHRTSTVLLERATYTANGLPGIVIALALVTAAIRYAQPIYQTTLLLVAAYLTMFLPRAVVSARAALAQSPPILDDIAQSLGSRPITAFRRVLLPLIAPGLGAGAALVFIAASTELTATLLLAPIGTQTLATQFWSASGSLDYGAAAPYAVLMILISAPATYLLTRERKQLT